MPGAPEQRISAVAPKCGGCAGEQLPSADTPAGISAASVRSAGVSVTEGDGVGGRDRVGDGEGVGVGIGVTPNGGR